MRTISFSPSMILRVCEYSPGGEYFEELKKQSQIADRFGVNINLTIADVDKIEKYFYPPIISRVEELERLKGCDIGNIDYLIGGQCYQLSNDVFDEYEKKVGDKGQLVVVMRGQNKPFFRCTVSNLNSLYYREYEIKQCDLEKVSENLTKIK